MTRVEEKHLAVLRFLPSLVLGIMMAAAVLSGSGPAYAESPYAIRDPKVPKNLSPASRARLQRTAAINKLKEIRQSIIAAAKNKDTASDNTKKGATNDKTK